MKTVVIKLRVQPNAGKDDICGLWMDAVKIKVNAPPQEGRANEAVILFLSDKLGISRKSIQIIKGESNRNKQVLITGLDKNDVLARLGLT